MVKHEKVKDKKKVSGHASDMLIQMKAMREELGLNQEDWARLIQVEPNTVARWERLEMEPRGGYKRRVELLLEFNKDEQIRNVIGKTVRNNEIAATAGFIGMLWGVLNCYGTEHVPTTQLFKFKPSLFEGILMYRKEIISIGKDPDDNANTNYKWRG